MDEIIQTRSFWLLVLGRLVCPNRLVEAYKKLRHKMHYTGDVVGARGIRILIGPLIKLRTLLDVGIIKVATDDEKGLIAIKKGGKTWIRRY